MIVAKYRCTGCPNQKNKVVSRYSENKNPECDNCDATMVFDCQGYV